MCNGEQRAPFPAKFVSLCMLSVYCHSDDNQLDEQRKYRVYRKSFGNKRHSTSGGCTYCSYVGSMVKYWLF